MPKPVLVCTADISHLPETRAHLETAFELCVVRPATSEALARALPLADAYFASLEVRLTGDLMDLAPRLKAIATPTTGLDHLDLTAAAERSIAVLSIKNERALLDRITATAELAWALVLACSRRLPAAFDATRAGHWSRDALRGHQLAEKTCGIIGCGRLGTMVAQYARAFRMTVVGNDTREIHLDGVENVPLNELLTRSDVVSMHIHLNKANLGFLNRERIFRMKPGAILVNTSRGAIVDENAVIDALNAGHLGAYGTDVIDGEWREDLENHPLIRHAREHDNVVITPHIGGITYESQALAYKHAAGMLVDYCRRIGLINEEAAKTH